MDKFLETNDLGCLPLSVQNHFKVRDCLVYIDLTEELVKHWIDFVQNTISDIRDKEKQYKQTGKEEVFFDDPEQVKKQSYYFATLCSYSANKHKPYKKYLDRLEAESSLMTIGKPSSSSDNDDDFDWLNGI